MKNKIILFFLFLISLQTFSQKKLIEKKSKSYIKVPVTHFDFNQLEAHLSDSIHTSMKPLHFFEIDSTVFNNYYQSLVYEKKTWFGRKLLDEHFFAIDHDDYWITIDPVVDINLGKDNLMTQNYLFQNTRGIRVEGSLGKQFSFSSTIAENMARYPVFYDRYIWNKRPRIVPGMGLSKSDSRNYVDYPYAEGYFSYRPSKYFFFEIGHGNHFIGEGYRSLFLSDNSAPYPYFKIDAGFWHVKYTTMWSAYQDVRPEISKNGVFKKKFSAIHHISWNALPKLNFGFFETVIWYNENGRGFDVNYLNPLIFFKTVELESGSGGSNTIVGLSAHYKTPYNIDFYGQFILDEMTIDKFFGDVGYWGNKYGFQLGIKYHDAFKIPNLFLRLEYNKVRPYTYSHNNLLINYTHNYQALAHPWGGNFDEKIFEIQYRNKRFYAQNRINLGKKGFDFPADAIPYGGDLYNYINATEKARKTYTFQGNLGNLLMNQFEIGYIVNPATNLKLFAGTIFRKTTIDTEISLVKNESTRYFYFGLKTQLWNRDLVKF